MKTLKNYFTIFILAVFLISCSEEKDFIENAESIKDSNIASKFTPKPVNNPLIPTKVPTSVICNYFAATGGWPSEFTSSCGINWNGQTAPISLQQLNNILAQQRTHTINDLYIVAPGSPNGIMPFSSYTIPDNLSIRSEIISFYQKVFVVQLNQSITVTGNITQAEHIHKLAFIDSFFRWMNRIQITQPNSFNLLMNNNLTYRQMFNLFADYNLNQPPANGIYLGVPNGQNSTNEKLRCLTVVSEFLLTTSGSSMLQSLSSGSISINQFQTQLNLLCF